MTRNDWHPTEFLIRNFPGSFEVFPVSDDEIAVKKLPWDSEFFGSPIFKIDYLPEDAGSEKIVAAIPEKEVMGLVFAEVPTRATCAIRNLGKAGFTMVETRLTYFHTLKQLPVRTKASRMAVSEDLPFLQKTASGAVNEFDRYHTDLFFSNQMANRYLETYISNCLNGFAETIFVPDLPDPPASFVAVSNAPMPNLKSGLKFYRIPLTACLPENRGWHYHLCLEALHYAANQGAIALVMTTQAANSAVIHNCEKLGFKLGSTFHIFSRELS